MAGLEPLWDYISENHPALLGPLGILLCHEITYFGAFLPYWICDKIPAARKYKLQPNEKNENWKLWRCLKLVLFLHFCVEFPMILISHPYMNYLGLRRSSPLPPWSEVAWQCLACFFIEDFYFYWIHRFLHWNKIYKYVHKVHHTHAAPFGIAAEYAHPIETLFLGIGTAAGPILFTLFMWLIVRVLQTVEVHSGYDFPWHPMRLVPGLSQIWGGAKFHDYHHMTFRSNYASTFTIWDNVFGTTDSYYQYIKDPKSTLKLLPKEEKDVYKTD